MGENQRETEERLAVLQEQNRKLDRIIQLLEQNAGAQGAAEAKAQNTTTLTEAGVSELQTLASELRQEKAQELAGEWQQANAQNSSSGQPENTQNASFGQPVEQSQSLVQEPLPVYSFEEQQALRRAAFEEQRRRERMERGRYTAPKGFPQPRPNGYSPAAKKPDDRIGTGTLESRIGSTVIGIIGVVLILAALTIIGINYMNDTLQGILLFLGAAGITAIGEFPVRKRLPKFSIAITSLGVAALYLAIILNYFYLLRIPGWAAIVLTVIVTGISVLLSKRNQSAIIRCIALVGSYVCIFPLESSITTAGLMVVITIVSLIDLGHLFVPLKENNTVADIITNLLNLILFLRIKIISIKTVGVDTEIVTTAFAYITIIMACFLCYFGWNRYEKEKQRTTLSVAAGTIAMVITALIALSGLSASYFWYLPAAAIAAGMMLLSRKSSQCFAYLPVLWVAMCAFLANWTEELFIGTPFQDEAQARFWGIWIVLTLITLLLGNRFKSRILFAWNICVFGISAVAFLFLEGIGCSAAFLAVYILVFYLLKEKEPCAYKKEFPMVGRYIVLLDAVIFGYRWLDFLQRKSNRILFGEDGFFGTYLFYCTLAAIAFVMIGTLVQRYRHSGTLISNTVILTTAVVSHLLAPNSHPVEFILLFLAGSAILLLLWKAPYVRPTRHTPLIYCIYCSYMYIAAQYAFDIKIDIILTIGLMVIAVLGVTYGCVKKQKSLRIYSLVLSAIVCFKLIFIDLSGIDMLLRIILFLSVGILALVISYVYNRTEKTEAKQVEARQAEEKQQEPEQNKQGL